MDHRRISELARMPVGELPQLLTVMAVAPTDTAVVRCEGCHSSYI